MLDLVRVDLCKIQIEVPVWQKKGKKGGKTLLITAGVDGDEYAGIEAANQIIQDFSKKSFSGQLIIIPILNIPGFHKGLSKNPIDEKYPKNIFPGKKRGSASERLICWLQDNFLKKSDFWLDLHSGATDEQLTPFLYAVESKNKKVNKVIEDILKKTHFEKVLYRKPGSWRKVERLAKKGIAYLISESGQLGQIQKIDIQRHLKVASEVMAALNMIVKKQKNRAKTIYRNISLLRVKRSGVWYPNVKVGKKTNQKQIIGKVKSLEGKTIQELKSESGEVLWLKIGSNCQKADCVGAVAY